MINKIFFDSDFVEVTIDPKKAQGKTLADLCQEIEKKAQHAAEQYIKKAGCANESASCARFFYPKKNWHQKTDHNIN